ncbi:ARF-GAP domain 1 [Actinidia rufa]|uniref:ARF-GAP domain 1 n=1 Tax=Actinidia rufa TaxID=165716 RepID=A0A7J0H148_9ERIC|nr:ARF-GAP domain 1 [Actinidia rufa]
MGLMGSPHRDAMQTFFRGSHNEITAVMQSAADSKGGVSQLSEHKNNPSKPGFGLLSRLVRFEVMLQDNFTKELYHHGIFQSNALAANTGTMRRAVGAVSGKRSSDGQVRRLKILERESVYMFRLLPAVALRPSSSAVIVPSLLISDNSELTMALAGTAVVFGHDCSELRHGGPPSLLYSDSLIEISAALARPMLDSVHTEFWHKGLSSLLSSDSLVEAPVLVRYLVGKPMPASCLPFAFVCHSAINVGDTRPSLVRCRALEYWRRGPSPAPRARLVRTRGPECSGGQCGPHPGSHLANLPGRASIPNQSAAVGGDGALMPHLHAVRPKELGNPFYEGNHYLRLRNPNQPQTRLVIDSPDKDLFLDDFVWVSRGWEFRTGMTAFGHSRVAPHLSCIAIIVPSLLISDNSELTMALIGTTIVFGHDCSELRHGGPPSLLCSDSLVEISALARPMLDSVCIEFRHRGLPSLLSSDSSVEAPALVRSGFCHCMICRECSRTAGLDRQNNRSYCFVIEFLGMVPERVEC